MSHGSRAPPDAGTDRGAGMPRDGYALSAARAARVAAVLVLLLLRPALRLPSMMRPAVHVLRLMRPAVRLPRGPTPVPNVHRAR